MRLYEIQGFGACPTEELLLEGWLDSVKKTLGSKVDQVVTTVSNTASALQVFYKIGTDAKYLETCTFLLKKDIKNKLKVMGDGPIMTKLREFVSKIFPKGRGLMDFIKSCLICAALKSMMVLVDKFNSAKKLANAAVDQVKDQASDAVKTLITHMTGLDQIINNLTQASGVFTILQGMGVANEILFDLLTNINKKNIINISWRLTSSCPMLKGQRRRKSMWTHPPKYPSSPHWIHSPEVHRDDSTHKDPEWFIDKEVSITEKLDGGNTCLHAGEAYARSTGQPATQGWFAMVKKHHAWKTSHLAANIAIYGEDLYGVHSIAYDAMKEDETYRVFNVREDDMWMGLDQRNAWLKQFGFLTVPLLFRGKFSSVKEISQWFEQHIKEPSALGPEREGFVMQVTDPFHVDTFSTNVAKYVRKGHVQTPDKHWTRNWQPCNIIRGVSK